MWRDRVLTLVLLSGLAAGCASVTPDVPTVVPNMPETQDTAQIPMGFLGFCLRFPDQCVRQSGARSIVSMTTQTWGVLNKVNTNVNNTIWPEEDDDHYGRSEYWTIPTDGYGDCEDYALTKRKDLQNAGIPLQALRLAVVITSRGARHAVLTVATDKGDLVLDNMTGQIQPWNKTDFIWIERQDSQDPMKWVSLLPASANTAGTATAATNPTAGTKTKASLTGSTNTPTSDAGIPKKSIDNAPTERIASPQ